MPWEGEYTGQSVVVVCRDGLHLSQGVGALMRQQGIDAQTLEGGYEAWRGGGQLLVRTDRLPEPDESGRTIWVTRARPKVVRIACPWLVRRFIDPRALFLFVAPSEVAAVAVRFKATPFDVPDAFWSDRGEKCTFDVMVEEFGARLGRAEPTGAHRSRSGYWTARSDRPIGRSPCRVTRIFTDVPRRSRSARRRDGALRRVVSLVPRRIQRDARLTCGLAAAPRARFSRHTKHGRIRIEPHGEQPSVATRC